MTDAGRPFPSYRPGELLGVLNAVEQKNAPDRLHAVGDIGLLKDTLRVSIVGTRHPSPEGGRRAERLARELVGHGVVIVSGLAEGVDTVAHETAIAHGGRTIAVLGTPLGIAYPAKNQALQERLAREHLVLSQFPAGHPVLRTNFPRRNRTMALVSDATVIIEAGDTSGSLSQGWEALRLGRALFIAQSVAEAPRLRWPGEMRRYGAAVLTKTEEILDVLPVGTGGQLATLTA